MNLKDSLSVALPNKSHAREGVRFGHSSGIVLHKTPKFIICPPG